IEANSIGAGDMVMTLEGARRVTRKFSKSGHAIRFRSGDTEQIQSINHHVLSGGLWVCHGRCGGFPRADFSESILCDGENKYGSPSMPLFLSLWQDRGGFLLGQRRRLAPELSPLASSWMWVV